MDHNQTATATTKPITLSVPVDTQLNQAIREAAAREDLPIALWLRRAAKFALARDTIAAEREGN